MDASTPTSGALGRLAAMRRPLLERPALFVLWCFVASFGAYACMYGLRKPFTAGSYTQAPFEHGFKAWLVTAQVLGYTISKILGIRIIAALPAARRAALFLALVAIAQIALILFAWLPRPWNIACLFLNGLPLGLVFGLVLGFLEGRKMTEAFVAGLCASFILADGFAKSVGAQLLANGVPERWMPATAGFMFLLPLIGFVWMLSRIPPPGVEDIKARSERTPMNRADRRHWLRHHGVGVGLVVLAYLLVTVLRSLRADFAPELWTALGVESRPEVFTRSELWVTLGVVTISAASVFLRDNRKALAVALITSLLGLGLVALALTAHSAGHLSAFGFMVLLGLGLYLPYVAIHTSVFERLIALTRDKGNLGYLMYLADAAGYLGYVVVMLGRDNLRRGTDFLEFFRLTGWIVSAAAALALAGALWQFLCFGSPGTRSDAPSPSPDPAPAGASRRGSR